MIERFIARWFPLTLGRAHREPMWVVWLTRTGVATILSAGILGSTTLLIAGLVMMQLVFDVYLYLYIAEACGW